MKQLIRRLSKVADSSCANSTISSSSYCLLRSETLGNSAKRSSQRRHGRIRGRRSVPSGHLPVYVGEEMERFVVSADLLNHPIFAKLLNRCAQEYGYDQKGVLHIPCNVAVFELVLDAIDRGDISRDVYDIINSLSPHQSSTSDGVFL